MENRQKPRIVKDYEKLPPEIQEQLKLAYPFGFSKHLISYKNKEGKNVSALPFETDEVYYLVRMTQNEARQIIAADEDFDEFGNLKDSIREEYEDKYKDLSYMSNFISDDGDDSEEDEGW